MKRITKSLIILTSMAVLLGYTYTANAQPVAVPAAMAAPKAVVKAPVVKAAPKPAVMKVAPKRYVKRAVAPKVTPKVVAPTPVAATTPVAVPTMATAPVATPVAAPAPVMAAPKTPVATVPAAKQDSKGSVVGGWLLQMLLYLIGILVAAFLPVLTAWAYKKLKISNLEHKDQIDAAVLKAAMFGIGKAEEAAYKLRDNPMESAKKLDIAVKGANQYLVDSGLPEKGAAYLADLIESKLGLSRATVPTVPKKEEVAAPAADKEEPKKEAASAEVK